jgi:hypothetical protein
MLDELAVTFTIFTLGSRRQIQVIQSNHRTNGSDRNKKETHSKKLTLSKAKKLQIYEQRWLLKPMYPSRKFQYEHQLQSEERTLKEIGDKLDAIERQLQASDDSGVKADISIY